MPRKACVDPKSLLDALKLHDIFDENKRLKSRSDVVWKYVCSCFKLSVTPESINAYVRGNRWNLLNDLKQYFDVPISEVLNDSKDTTLNSSNVSEYYPSTVSKNKDFKIKYPLLFINLVLSAEDWIKMYPVSNMCDKENNGGISYYRVLKKGWTDLVAKEFFLKTKVPCAYIFKYGKVHESPEAEVFLKIHGSCKECAATFDAHSIKKPAPGDGIIISIQTFDTRGVPHSAKRPVKGVAREIIGHELISKKPRLWRNEQINNISFGDPEPPYLPHGAAARKIKEEAINIQLSIESNHGVIESLCKMKTEGRYSGYIKEIGVDKMYCMYWSRMQIHLYKDLIKKVGKIEIDATGSLVKSYTSKKGTKRCTLLYQIIIPTENGVQPLFSMLSQKHDANFICYWLREIMRDGAPCPPEVVCDYSMALLNATCLAFNEKSLRTYIFDCYRSLSNGRKQGLMCFIRIDIAHLIKILCRTKVFDGKHFKIKDFYVRCLGIMSICNNIEDFKKLFLSVLIVAGNEYEGKSSIGENTACLKNRNLLFEKIKKFNYTYKNNDEIEDLNECDYEHLDIENDDVLLFIENIQAMAQEAINSTEETESLNAFYCPEVATHFIRFGKHFPLWTNVMQQFFPQASNVATSAHCEAYFNTLKNNDLGTGYLPLRSDKFIAKHINSIESLSKLNFAQRLQSKRFVPEQFSIKLDAKANKAVAAVVNYNEIKKERDYNHLRNQENWCGLNIEAVEEEMDNNKTTVKRSRDITTILKENSDERFSSTLACKTNTYKENTDCRIPIFENRNTSKRGKYLIPFPEIQFYYERPLRKRKCEVLQNGNICNPVVQDGEKVYVQNTCAFDSIMELIAYSYCNYACFKDFVDLNADVPIFSFIIKYANEGINPSLYNFRARLLSMVFKIDNGFLDCYGSAYTVIVEIFANIKNFELITKCTNCTEKVKKVNILDMDGFGEGLSFGTYLNKFLQQTLIDREEECKRCSCTKTVILKEGPFIFIDTQVFLAINKSKYNGIISLAEIPGKIRIQDIEYVLGGVVCHKPEHYTAYCRSVTGTWLEKNDLEKLPKQIRGKVSINVESILYIRI